MSISGNSHDPAPVDVAVVGGGIVGMATAHALLESGAGRVVVLEAEPELARHQTGRNSGIIHSGLYYAPGSAKARLCTRGRDALYRFCAQHEVPFRRTGKLVVATTGSELRALERLAERGRANGLQDISLLDGPELRQLEPRVAGLAALHVQETGLVDFARVTRTLARLVERHGADEAGTTPNTGGTVLTSCRVLSAEADARRIRIRTSRGPLEAAVLVNCAGLQADRVARRCGVRPRVRIAPFRGDYFQVRSGGASLVSRPIYPVPDPAFPFLGVHLHPTLDGGLEAGPNAVPAFSRTGYSPFALRIGDALEVLAFPGFWRLALRHWRRGITEVARALSRRRLAREVQSLVPTLEATDLGSRRCGIRAQALDQAGRLLDDFHIQEGPRSLHVLNAPSPAATAALAIGEEVAGRVLEDGHL